MKKSFFVLFVAALLSVNAMAQTVQEGISNWYAERYQSAKNIFEKLTAANPNNLEAVYWLGQTGIAQGDVAGAKAVYQRTLSANGNAPLVLAGMGQIDLLEGRAADARTKFEQAIAASKGKKGNDPAVLTAVARANVQPYTDDKKIGDLDYAIAKLNEALQVAPTNADAAVVLGNAYRKKHDGGNAVLSYRKAGNYAPALYRTASIYQSQQNWDAATENLNATIAADPKFAPAYEDYYAYSINTTRDLAAADKYGQLYVSNSDPSPDNDYILASNKYLRKDYQGAVDIANKIVQATNNAPKARVYRLLGYSSLELKDTAKACDYANRFFTRAAATNEEILANDYILLHAKACGRGNPTVMSADIDAAQHLLGDDKAAQLKMLNAAIIEARSQKQYGLEGELLLRSYALRTSPPSAAEQFYTGTLFYYGENYPKSDSVLSAYITAFPDSLQGYYWRGLDRLKIDTASKGASAVPDFEKTLQLAETDKVRFKSQAAQAAYILAAYYNNVKGDRPGALAAANKGLEFDPADASLQNLQKLLSGGKASTPPKTTGKPAADSSKSKVKGKA